MIGKTISHYEIEAELGQGGMGKVYLAHDTLLGRKVAIKVISPALVADAGLRARLLREARAAARLDHPNVVTVHEIGEDQGTDFIVMERVEGRPLSDVIPAGGLPIAQVVDLATQLAGAMAAAHAAHIVHRDLKPSNVMVTPAGRVKLLDLGLARLIEPREADEEAETRTQSPTGLTAQGALMGTIGYASPEQLEGKPADERSDVFSLGVVLYEMLSGRRPFVGDTPVAVLAATVAGSAPEIGSLRVDTPAALARIVERCLAKRPEDRYLSAAGLADDLARLVPQAGRRVRRHRMLVSAFVALGVAAVAIIAGLLVRESRMRWALEKSGGEIARLKAREDVVGAYVVARKAVAIAPHDSRVLQAFDNVSTSQIVVTSDPPGANVAIRSFLAPDAPWIPLGRTPTAPTKLPFGYLRWRLTLPGYDTLEVAQGVDQREFRLVPAGTAPPGMVLVPRGSYQPGSAKESVALPEYWIDRYEVTNREYKAFVDSGGYRRPEFWKEPFVKDGRTLSFTQAMAEFRDATGRPGPSTWELGSYPEGQADFPVAGVSWYEAAAYAVFAGKRLPTVYHWYRAAHVHSLFSDVIEASNFSGRGPSAVGSTGGLGPFGTYDMAGNVKEWCANSTGDGRRYILGGSWGEPSYMFQDQDAQSPFDRRVTFGFRCMRQDTALDARLTADIKTLEPDPSRFKPVSNEVFQAYRHLYDYDPSPLDPKVEMVDDESPAWRREKISIRCAYGDERLPIYLFLPKSVPPPWQAVIYFPGGDAVNTASSQHLRLGFADFQVRAGRALVWPIYKGTYERRVQGRSGSSAFRDAMIEGGKDLRRTVDYLQSRSDVDGSKIAFFGLSYGAELAPLFLAIEPRLKTGVLWSGGLESWELSPEIDPVNFAPHVTQPVLMVNGREDFALPYATSQVPLFRMLGTPDADKRHVVLEGGHVPTHPEKAIKVMLDWLDEKLGPVR